MDVFLGASLKCRIVNPGLQQTDSSDGYHACFRGGKCINKTAVGPVSSRTRNVLRPRRREGAVGRPTPRTDETAARGLGARRGRSRSRGRVGPEPPTAFPPGPEEAASAASFLTREAGRKVGPPDSGSGGESTAQGPGSREHVGSVSKTTRRSS